MKIIILLILFIPIVFKALREKDWYVCLFFAFYIVLPDTFAIEISRSFPLLTGSRVLILINLFFLLYKDNWKVRVIWPKYLLHYYTIIFCIITLNLLKYVGGVADIFNLFFEQIIVVWIIYRNVVSNERLKKYLNYLLMGFSANCVIGTMQTILGFDVSTALNLVEARRESGLALRMGLNRASGTTGSAIIFASECAFMFLVSLYLYENSGKKIYIFACALNIGTMLCTLSRSSMLSLFIVISLMALLGFKKFVHQYLRYVLCGGILLGVACCFSPKLLSTFIEPAKSILNIFGANFVLSESFGHNANNPANSRLFQWSALEYMALNGNLLLGYGYKAYTRGLIHFQYVYYGGQHVWDVAQALDVGFVRIAAERGIIGLSAHLCLLCKIIIICIRKRKYDYNRKKLSYYHFMVSVVVLYILNNVLTAYADTNLIWIFFGIFFAYDNLVMKKERDIHGLVYSGSNI